MSLNLENKLVPQRMDAVMIIEKLAQERLLPVEKNNFQAQIALNAFERIVEQNPKNEFFTSQYDLIRNIEGDPIEKIQSTALNYVTRAMFESLYFFADYESRVYRNSSNDTSQQSIKYANLVEQLKFASPALAGIKNYLSRIATGAKEKPYDYALDIFNQYELQGNDLLNTFARIESFLVSLNYYFQNDVESIEKVGSPLIDFLINEFELLQRERKVDLNFDTDTIFKEWLQSVEDYKMTKKHFSGYNQRTKSQLADLTSEIRNDNLIEFLKELGTVRSKGSIFWGGAGTGKSRAAEKFAEMLNWNSKTIKVSELMSQYMHGTAEKIGKQFEEVRLEAEKSGKKTIVIIDEADALIGKFRASNNGAKDASEVRATLLTELQIESPWVYYIFTTNFDPGDRELIDEAITRSGRMGKHVMFELPDKIAISEIILGILEKPSVDISHLDIDLVSNELIGLTPAQISELLGDVAKKCFKGKNIQVRIDSTQILKQLHKYKNKDK
jgi:ATP-dependent 26S proteasome regulatory subunit